MSYKLKQILPFFVLFMVLGILAQQLFFAKKNELPSPLIGEPIPQFLLPTLFSPDKKLTNQAFLGKAALLNVWATWCEACVSEHQMLLKISRDYHVPIYGLIYKDNAQDAKKWLLEKGNPYVAVGNDARGDVAIDFGVYGTPETFVVSPQGKIIYRQIGPLDEKTWQKIIYPMLKQYEVQS